MDSHIRELRNRGISAASLSIKEVNLQNLLKEAYAFLFVSPSYKTRSGETCFVLYLRSYVADENISQTCALTPAKLVKRYHSSPPARKTFAADKQAIDMLPLVPF